MAIPTYLTDGNGNAIEISNGSIPITTTADAASSVIVVPQLDSGAIDAFGRQRVSQLSTLFDSKLLNDAHPHLWDESEVSGGGTSGTYNSSRSDVKMSVTANTAGKRVRQTLQRFNYFSGKSHLIFQTFVCGDAPTGITKQVGYFDDNNGLFFEHSENVISMCKRSKVTGSVVDTKVVQDDWNLDKLDGTGTSGFTFNCSQAHILIVDFEWLGVGRVRMGFVIDGQIIYVHAFNHANVVTSVYMTSPNLPLRYSIENDGTGTAQDLYCVCGSVSTEGAVTHAGVPYSFATTASVTLPDTANTYALFVMRLKSTHQDSSVVPHDFQAYCGTADDVLVQIVYNPTITGNALSYSGVTNSAVEVATCDASNRVTVMGSIAHSDYLRGKTQATTLGVDEVIPMGAFIDGTSTTIALVARGFTASAKCYGCANWRED